MGDDLYGYGYGCSRASATKPLELVDFVGGYCTLVPFRSQSLYLATRSPNIFSFAFNSSVMCKLPDGVTFDALE